MLSANEDDAFAITADNKVVGSIGVFRQGNIHRQTAELGYYLISNRDIDNYPMKMNLWIKRESKI